MLDQWALVLRDPARVEWVRCCPQCHTQQILDRNRCLSAPPNTHCSACAAVELPEAAELYLHSLCYLDYASRPTCMDLVPYIGHEHWVPLLCKILDRYGFTEQERQWLADFPHVCPSLRSWLLQDQHLLSALDNMCL
jgi:hypothetical protein